MLVTKMDSHGNVTLVEPIQLNLAIPIFSTIVYIVTLITFFLVNKAINRVKLSQLLHGTYTLMSSI